MLEACLMTEVPECAKNEPISICGLEQKSHLGRRHVCGQIGSIGSREHATWTEEQEHKSQLPWAGGDDFCDQCRDRVDAGLYYGVRNMAR
jgi:hypothetical protein